MELSDFWIAVPEYAPGYVVQVEVYEDEQLTQLLGYTDWKPLEAGTTNLGT